MPFTTATSAVHNRKVNLEVRTVGAAPSEVTYEFRFTSYETSAVPLNQYRVVAFNNLTATSGDWVGTQQFTTGTGFGSTTGSLNSTAPTLIPWVSKSKPPRIRPDDKRYTCEMIIPFDGTATATGSGSGFTGHQIRLRYNDFRNFSMTEGIPNGNLITGQTALAKSYTYTSNGSYENNSTFVLEYNNAGQWVKVQEFTGTNINDNDAQTGVYPYNDIFENSFIANPSDNNIRNYGIDTKSDHVFLDVDLMTYINQAAPNTTNDGTQTFSLDGSGVGGARRGLIGSTQSGGITSGFTLSAGEIWLNVQNATQSNYTYGMYSLTQPWVESTATWNNTINKFPSSAYATVNIGTNQASLNGDTFMVFTSNIDNIDDISGNGWGLKYLDETNNGLNSPVFTTDDVATSQLRPFIIVNTSAAPSVSGTGEYIWTGNVNSDWNNPLNWQTLATPGSLNTAIFDGSISNNNCTLNTNVFIKNLIGRNNYSGNLNLSTFTLNINTSADFKNIGTVSAGTSTVTLSGPLTYITFGDKQLYNLTSFGTTTITNTDYFGGVNNNANFFSNVIFDDNLEFRGNISVSGSSLGNSKMIIIGGTLTSAGTLNAPISFERASTLVPARRYDGLVSFVTGTPFLFPQNLSYTFKSGTHLYQNGIYIDEQGSGYPFFLDLETYNPQVNLGGNLEFAGTLITYMKLGTKNIKTSGTNIEFGVGSVGLSGFSTQGGGIEFIGNSNQTIVPLINNDIPPIIVNKNNTLKINTNHLYSKSLTINKGTLDLNGRYIYCKDDIIVNNGNNNTFNNLSNSNIRAKNISLNGVGSGNLLRLNATTPYFISASESLNANFSNIGNSNANGVTGYAANSINSGFNTNWQFVQTPPTIIFGTPSPNNISNSTITLPGTATDSNILFSSVGLVNDSIGVMTNKVSASSSNVTFDVVVSAASSGLIKVSATDVFGGLATSSAGFYAYDVTPPTITFGTPIPSTGESNSSVLVPITVDDNIAMSTNNLLAATIDGVSITPKNKVQVDQDTITFTLNISQPVIQKPLSVCATDTAGNITNTISSQLYTVDNIKPNINFTAATPPSKIAFQPVVSAVVTDNYKMSTNLSNYTAKINGIDQTISKVDALSVSATIVEIKINGTGDLIFTATDSVGNLATCSDPGYVASNTFLFGNITPNRYSKLPLTIPISAIGFFDGDVNNYYSRVDNTQTIINNFTSAAFGVITMDVNLSGVNDITGQFIISGGTNQQITSGFSL